MIEILTNAGCEVGSLREPGQERGTAHRKRIGMSGCSVPPAKTPGLLFIPDLSLRYLSRFWIFRMEWFLLLMIGCFSFAQI